MKALVMGLALALAIARCSSDVSATEVPEENPAQSHACKCESKVSDPVWRYGTLCKKGEMSQGHAPNPQGKVVSGCVTISHACVCEG